MTYVSPFQQACREFAKPVQDCTVDPFAVTAAPIEPSRRWTPEERLEEDIRDAEDRFKELGDMYAENVNHIEQFNKQCSEILAEYIVKELELARLKAQRDAQ